MAPPLLEPFWGSLWADTNPPASVELPGLARRNKDRLAALASLADDELALNSLLGSVRSVLDMHAVDQATTEQYVATLRERVERVSSTLADGFLEPSPVSDRGFLSDLWWLDEVFTALSLGGEGALGGLGGAVDLPPVARGDQFFFLLDGAMLQVGAAEGVLANDFDPLGQSLAVTLVVPPEHAAKFELYPDGGFAYQPVAGFTGRDAFTYRASDGRFTDEGTAEILVMGDPPVAVDDTAYAGPGDPPTDQQQITIYVLQNDTGDGIMVSSVGPAQYGTTSGYGPWVYYRPGPQFGTAPGKSPVDSFSYTIRDYYGRTASATVTVHAVGVTGYTVQWQKPDDTWQTLGEEDLSWVGDDLRWWADYSEAGLAPYYSGTVLWRRPYGSTQPWAQFAGGQGWVYTGADWGEWAIQAEVRFAGMPWQSAFATRQEFDGYRLTPEITAIQWTAHTANPQEAGDLVPTGNVVRFFPDAAAPGQAARPKVDVDIRVRPATTLRPVPILLQLRLYDVDDPAIGLPDGDLPPVGTNSPDNFRSGGGVAPLPPFPGFVVVGSGGAILTLDVGEIQPGNNFRVLATGHAEIAALVKALDHDDQARLYFDRNNDDILSPGEELGIIDHTMRDGVWVTRELEVWRRLHIEVDSMGLVEGNTVTGQITHVGQPDWGNMTVTVTTDQFLNDSPDRFVPGQLTSNNRDFNVVANSVGDNFTVTVRFYAGPGGPELPAEGPFILLDDDTVVDGMDVPMPDTSELRNAMAEAYVEVLYDVGDANGATVFQANLASDSHFLAARDWDSQASNYDEFWVTYLLGGYQGPFPYDNDADSETPLYGWISPFGGAVVFLETIQDASQERGLDNLAFRRDRVVADVGRTVAQIWGNDNDAFQIQTPVTGWPDQPARYTGEYLWRIRNSPRPLGL